MVSLKSCAFGSFWSILLLSFLEVLIMKPLSRSHVSKHRSARKFRAQSSRTKAPNMRAAPMRGGWRL